MKLLRILGLCLVATAARAQEAPAPLALVGATVVGQEKLGPATVLLRGGRIEQVGARAKVTVPDDAEVLEVEGRYLVPGLIDLASECGDPDCLALNLYFGVTTLRSVGKLGPDLGAGLSVAPRVVAAAPVDLAGSQPGAAVQIHGPKDLDLVLSELSGRGARWILAEPAVGPELLRELVTQARAQGLKVGARLGATGLDQALGMGLDSVEHISSVLTSHINLTPFAYQKDAPGLYLRYVVPQLALLDLPGKISSGAFRAAGKSGAAVLPGLASIEYPVLRRAPQMQKLPGALQREPDRHGATSIALREGFDQMKLLTLALRDAGALIAVGSRSPGAMNVPGYAVQRELQLLVEAGFTPAQALAAGTEAGARVLGLADVGKIAPGMAADFLVLGADPLADIAALEQIEHVVAGGRAVERESLLQSGAVVQRVGSPWTRSYIHGFDDQSLTDGGLVHGQLFPPTGAASPRLRFIESQDGYYVRLSGRVQDGEEAGLRLQLSADGQRPWDMASYSGPTLRVRGNNQQFWLRVRTLGVRDQDFFIGTFQAGEDWNDVQIPWKTLWQAGQGKQLAFSARDVVGLDVYIRGRSGETFYQLDLDGVGLYE
jgi:hypothetical protein